MELFELGLIKSEQSLLIIELEKDLSLLLETDPDEGKNVLCKKQYLRYFKRNLRQSAVLKCKILAHSWLVLLDELGLSKGEVGGASEVLDVPFSRLLTSKIGLFTVLQLIMDKKADFDPQKVDFENPQKFHLLNEFVKQEAYHLLEDMEDLKEYYSPFLDEDTIQGLTQDQALGINTDYLKHEGDINWHITTMMKIVAIGGSWFGMENVAFSYPLYALTDLGVIGLKDFVELRG